MRKWLAGLMVLMLVGCNADQEFSTWPCRFSYDNSVYLDDVLASAMNNGSRGVFCQISETSSKGVRYLNFTSSTGQQSQKRETAMEMQANYILGMNNGIIVGFQTLNTDGAYGGFVAYDVQCPNCVRANNNYINPTFYIRMAATGIATCSKCGRKYDLNNNGILYREDGSKRLADNTLVALTLMIAESKTEEKDVMVKVVVNLINQRNE